MNAPREAFADNVIEALQAQADEFIAIRRDIHKHPEMGYKEYRTSDLVAEQLQAWGYAVTRGLGGTGVVGRLQRGSGSKTLGVRADMDALPMDEDTDLDFKSTIAGAMHACGHDIHMASWLGAATLLAKSRKDWKGTLVFIGQPAEEVGGGCARVVVPEHGVARLGDARLREDAAHLLLVHAERAGADAGADVRHPGQLQQALHDTVFTVRSVQ